MKYISTRGKASALSFDEVLLSGLASDGGLYVPAVWPWFSEKDIKAMSEKSYEEIAFNVLQPFVSGSITEGKLKGILQKTYQDFSHHAIAPIKQIGTNDWLVELFHGPTLAFKDYALQLVGRLLETILLERGQRVTVVGATSGDTGSAAIEACRGQTNIKTFILFPKNRVSQVQQRQMTTVNSPNVHTLAIEGTFDDCQDLVKALFNDKPFREKHKLVAVNSINWVRVMCQMVYYFSSGARLGSPQRKLSFAVPTGNFGNVLAGWAASMCGLPIEQLIVGTNKNDILFRFFETGEMRITNVNPSVSPSMDIQVSSNFERLLFNLLNNDGNLVQDWMSEFRKNGTASIETELFSVVKQKFSAARFSDEETKEVIKKLYKDTGELIDPHTAIGIAAGRKRRSDPKTPLVCIGTAHPAKFPEVVENSTGVHPKLPNRLSDLFDRVEKYQVVPNDVEIVENIISTKNEDS